jgi:hypothetical protein
MQETSTEAQKDATADGAAGPLAEMGQRNRDGMGQRLARKTTPAEPASP